VQLSWLSRIKESVDKDITSVVLSKREMNNDILKMRTDGGSRGNPGPASCGVFLPELDAKLGAYVGTSKTNNEAEYAGLILGLRHAVEQGYKQVSVESDSQLMVRQVLGEYRVKATTIIPLYEEAMVLLYGLDRYEIKHIARELNHDADGICNLILDRAEAGETFECLHPMTLS
jgi:ribonuclease HI